MLLSNQRQIIELNKFAYSPLWKAYEKQVKTTKNIGGKQIKTIEEHGIELVESNALIQKCNYDTWY